METEFATEEMARILIPARKTVLVEPKDENRIDIIADFSMIATMIVVVLISRCVPWNKCRGPLVAVATEFVLDRKRQSTAPVIVD